MKLASILLLFIVGCGPSKGDVYEHLLNRSRVQLEDVGQCSFLLEQAESSLEYVKEEYQGDDNLKMRLLLSRLPIERDIENKDGKCVTYEEENEIPAPDGNSWIIDGERFDTVPLTSIVIHGMEDFTEDYSLVR